MSKAGERWLTRPVSSSKAVYRHKLLDELSVINPSQISIQEYNKRQLICDDLITSYRENFSDEQIQAIATMLSLSKYLTQTVKDFSHNNDKKLLLAFAKNFRNYEKMNNEFYNLIDDLDHAAPFWRFLNSVSPKVDDITFRKILDSYTETSENKKLTAFNITEESYIDHPDAYTKEEARLILQKCNISSKESVSMLGSVINLYTQKYGKDILPELQQALQNKITTSYTHWSGNSWKMKFEEIWFKTMPELAKVLKEKATQELNKREQEFQTAIDDFFEKHGGKLYVVIPKTSKKWSMFIEDSLIASYPELSYSFRDNYFERVRNTGKCGINITYIKNRESDSFLLLNLKRIKESPERRLTLYVPAEMIGQVIGKGGENIKEIEKATGKEFKVLAGDFRTAQRIQDAKDRIAPHHINTQANSQQDNHSPKFSGPKGPNGRDDR